MGKAAEDRPTRWGRTKVIIHSFIVVPYLLALFGVVVFMTLKLIVGAPPSMESALETISRGSETERWQSALDLVSLLSSLEEVQLDQGFVDQVIFEYKRSAGERKLYLRTYLALAMGLTQDPRFEPVLLEGLGDSDQPSYLAAIKALGLAGGMRADSALLPLLDHDEQLIVLETVIALGRIGIPSATAALLPLLDHPEPNIRWDTAIALAKLQDMSGLPIINQLLDRNYLNQFPQVDINEQDRAISVAIEVAAQIQDPIFEENLIALTKMEDNLTLANAAMMALKKY